MSEKNRVIFSRSLHFINNDNKVRSSGVLNPQSAPLTIVDTGLQLINFNEQRKENIPNQIILSFCKLEEFKDFANRETLILSPYNLLSLCLFPYKLLSKSVFPVLFFYSLQIFRIAFHCLNLTKKIQNTFEKLKIKEVIFYFVSCQMLQ